MFGVTQKFTNISLTSSSPISQITVCLFHFETNARKLARDMVATRFPNRKPVSPMAREESATRKDWE